MPVGTPVAEPLTIPPLLTDPSKGSNQPDTRHPHETAPVHQAKTGLAERRETVDMQATEPEDTRQGRRLFAASGREVLSSPLSRKRRQDFRLRAKESVTSKESSLEPTCCAIAVSLQQ
jgi:hypothetical protein